MQEKSRQAGEGHRLRAHKPQPRSVRKRLQLPAKRLDPSGRTQNLYKLADEVAAHI